ncbi:PTS sugar transporter subunit IIC [Thorsellia anophelis]|uniref:Permease IIC component n=1 Tax=Thorsellia anophelis DSM 18579 TaxID=1123402 RepID=A0A1I0DKQ6_9GAMM|nr:PTS transporter subunit EIIC [Thorsellia anophelis]SET32743.1 PTS system, cellobiose-specific IIC component [Thorsellia anophelis DSM 18579]
MSKLDSFAIFAGRLGGQVHLRSLRDAFALLMPLFFLAGIAVLLNAVVFPWTAKTIASMIDGGNEQSILSNFQVFGSGIVNATLGSTSLLIAPAIAYMLSKNKGFDNPIASSVIALSILIVLMPLQVPIQIDGQVHNMWGYIAFSNIGTAGMFSGIVVGLLGTELFIFFNKRNLQIKLGENVPPQVGKSFAIMIPAILTICVFALLATLLKVCFETDLISFIGKWIQEPLRSVNTSLFGYILIYSLGNFLFTLGIHQTVLSGALLDPFMLINMNENVAAFNAGQEIPHILTSSFQTIYPQMGGTGGTISLLLAIFLFSKSKASRNVAKVAAAPSVFEINEPVIFGFPIVFNLPMIIPFVGVPIVSTLIAYYATALGMVSKTVVLIPWTTPPLISGYLATAGDWRAVLLQLLLIFIGAAIYLPFMKISEAIAQKYETLQEQSVKTV